MKKAFKIIVTMIYISLGLIVILLISGLVYKAFDESLTAEAQEFFSTSPKTLQKIAETKQ